MNSKRIPPFPLSTFASWPPQPPSSPLSIRAPLSPFEDSSSTSSTSSDDDDVLNQSGSGSDTEPAPVLVRSESMPVARLTGDEDFEVEEDEEFSDDSDGFVVRVPVINDGGGGGDANPDPRSDEDDEGNADLEESLDGVGVSGGNSAKDFFDGEEYSDVGRVSSKGGELSSNPVPSFDGDECGVGDDGKLENADEMRVLSENLNRDASDDFNGNVLSTIDGVSSYDGNPSSEPKSGPSSEPKSGPSSDNEGDENLSELGALGKFDVVIANSNQNQKLEDEGCSVPTDYGKSDGTSCNFDDSDGFVVRVPIINDGGGGDANPNPNPSSDDDEDGNADLEESLDGVGVLGENSAKDFFDGVEFSELGRVSSKGGELSSNPSPCFDGDGGVGDDGKLDSEKNADKIRVLSENLNGDVFDEFDGNVFSNVHRVSYYDGSTSSEPKASASFDNEGDENLSELGALGGNSNIVDFLRDSDGLEENFMHKEMQIGAADMGKYDGVIANSNQNKKLEDEDCSVLVDHGKSDGSSCNFDEGGDGKLSEGLNGVSNSLVESDVFEISFDNSGAVIETQSSVKDELAVTRLEHDSTVSEAKLKYAENDSLLDDNSKTGGCEKEIEEARAAEGVEGMDERAKVVEERHVSDEQMIKDSEEGPSSSQDHLRNITEENGGDEEEGKELYDNVSLLEFLKAMASSSTNGNNTILPTIVASPNLTPFNQPDNKMTKEEKNLHEQVESIRVKFLRIVHRLGHSPEVNMVTLVLHHLARIEDLKDWKSCFQNARKKAVELEMEEKDKLDFSCNFLVIGKAGVGKSATINSIFEEEKSLANPFQTETTSVRKIEGVVDGIKIQILDTPGLGASLLDQASNRKILSSVKKHMKRCPPDVVLYVDRLDTPARDFNDLPLLRSITHILGLSIWSKAIVALTHATEDPPEGPGGSSLSYEAFVAQRSHVVLESLRKATGDMGLTNPVALVENHPSCRWRRNGKKVLPNWSIWRSELLLLCYSSKILSDAFSIPKARLSSVRKLLPSSFPSPPMQFFLPSLLQSKDHPKLPLGLEGSEHSALDLEVLSDDEEEEDEYDQLPPFSPLSKSQIAKLSKELRRAYFAEYDYRVRLLQKKQLKELIRGLNEIKKRAASSCDDISKESNDAPTVAMTPAPDMVLPPSFDCDDPVYRYRSFEPTSRFFTGFVLNEHGWDHDCGLDGVCLENLLAIASRFPAEVSLRLRKDKNDLTINFDSSISTKHGQNGSSLASFDVHSVGDLLSYCLRGETKFKNSKKNQTTVGFSANRLGDTWAAGLKFEDRVSIGKKVNLTVKTGAVRAEGDVAYGTNLEATLMKTDDLIGQALATFGLSLIRGNGYLACGGTLQTEIEVGRNSKMGILVGLNSNQNGQITIRTSSREQLQMALLGLIPIALSFFRKIWYGESL